MAAIPLRGLNIDGKPVEWKDVPVEVLPPEMVNAFLLNERHGGVHVTDLTICPYHSVRQKALDYYEPRKKAWHLLRGNAWDYFSQKYPRIDGMYQRTFARSIDGVEIVGTPDVIDPHRKSIEDFKAPSKNHSGAPREYYIQQLNTYRWLTEPELEAEGININHLILLFMGPTDFGREEVDMWTFEQTEFVLRDRIAMYEWVEENGNLERCPARDCWLCKSASNGETIWVPR